MRRTFRRPLATAAALIALCAALGAHAAPAASAEAYVSNQNGDISVIDLATMQVTRTIDAYGKGPRGIGVTADGKLLVVANREGGSIALIDRKTGKLVRQVPIGAEPGVRAHARQAGLRLVRAELDRRPAAQAR